MGDLTITWIINIIFFVVLGLYFLSGFIRGFKKSILHLIFSFLGIGCSFLFCGTITKAILGIKVVKKMNLSDYIISSLEESESFGPMIRNSATFSEFIEKIPYIIVMPIVFLLIMILASLICKIVCSIVNAIIFRKPKNKGSIDGFYKRRGLGGAISLVEGFVFMLFLTFPLAGLTGMVSYAVTPPESEIEYTSDKVIDDAQVSIQAALPKDVLDIIIAYDDTLLSQFTKLTKSDAGMFDSLTRVKVNGEKVYLRREVKNMLDVYNNSIRIYNDYYEFNTLQIDYDDFEESFDNLLKSGLFKGVVTGTISEIVENHENIVSSYEIKNNDVKLVLSNMSKSMTEDNAFDYIYDDLTTVVNSVTTLGGDGIIDQLFILEGNVDTKINRVADNKKNKDVPEVVDSIFSMNIVQDCSEVVVDKIQDFLLSLVNGVDLKLNKGANMETVGAQLEKIVEDTLDLYKYNSKVIDVVTKPENLFSGKYDSSAILSKSAAILDQVRNLDILVVTEDESTSYELDKVTDKLLKGSLLGDEVVTNEGTKTITSYTQLVEFVDGSLNNIIDYNLYNIYKENKNVDDVILAVADALETNDTILEDTILPVVQISYLNKELNKVTAKADSTILDFTKLQTYEDWVRDLDNIKDTLKSLNKGDIEGKTYLETILGGESIETVLQTITDEELEDVMTPVLRSDLMSPVRRDMLNMISDKVSTFTGTQVEIATDGHYDETLGKNDQTEEVVEALKLIVDLYNEDTIDTNLIKAGELMVALQANAYRTERDAECTDAGVLTSTFEAMYTYLTTSFTYSELFNLKTEGLQPNEIDFNAILTEINTEINSVGV
ncbi:MAG: CvpA family protein [Clostridia bacterium]|nr:CvpA family protein [Clostridia bacterium]